MRRSLSIRKNKSLSIHLFFDNYIYQEFLSFFMKQRLDRFRVAIFGSARTKKKDSTYKQVFSLAKLLAEHEIGIVTGGGPGIMEAANKGHAAFEGKSKSVGLWMKLPFEDEPNNHLDVKKEFDLLSKRLDEFMKLANAVVIAPAGGIGTILELFYTWQLIQLEQIRDTPIILVGGMWKDLLKWMRKDLLVKKYIDEKDFEHVFVVDDCSEAFEIIEAVYLDYLGGKEIHCKNYDKYRDGV